MHRTFRKRQKPILSLIFSAFILLTIPIAIYSLLNSQSFDIRHLAYERTEHDTPRCTIQIPHVNSRTLEVERKYQVHVYTNIKNEQIKSLKINEARTGELFSKTYTTTTSNISETFAFSPRQLGAHDITGQIQTNLGIHTCKMDSTQEVVYVIEKNHPPEFLTDPYHSAQPPSSTLEIGQTYEYTLKVIDRDLDQIDYHYSFTPRAHWLKKTVVENGQNGQLKIRFSGTPDRDGSYLANIFVHDGHNKHLSAQSWVISIGDESTEIPVREEPKYPFEDIDWDFANEIILPEAQISNILPKENAFITNTTPTISANLAASHNATVDKDSIVFKLNDSNLITRSDIIQISEKETFIRYIPETNLDTGEHRVYVYFKDSMGEETDKEWTFTLETDPTEQMILGIPITTFMIFVVGILLILFAISIPWVIYIAWKKDQPEDYEEVSIIKPDGDSSYKETFKKES